MKREAFYTLTQSDIMFEICYVIFSSSENELVETYCLWGRGQAKYLQEVHFSLGIWIYC